MVQVDPACRSCGRLIGFACDSSGYIGKGGEDVVRDVPDSLWGTGGPKAADGLTWWLLTCLATGPATSAGWLVNSRRSATPAGGRRLVQKPRPEVPQPAFKPGGGRDACLSGCEGRSAMLTSRLMTSSASRQGTAVTILSGPRLADGLTVGGAPRPMMNRGSADRSEAPRPSS